MLSSADGSWSLDLGELAGSNRIEAVADLPVRSGAKLFHVAVSRRLAATNRVYALGDSRTLDNMRSGGLTTVGPMVWARQLSLGRITYGKLSNNGVGGATTAAIRAQQFPQALASDASVLVLLAGVNDANTGSLGSADTISNLTAMARDFVASDPGRVCLLLDELPVSGLQKPEQHLAVRDGIRALHDPAAGIVVVPSWNALALASDDAQPQSWAYRDGIHMAKRGAFSVGREIWAALQRVTTTFDPATRPGVLLGGNFVTAGAGPEGWTVPTGTGIATRMEAADGLNWLVMSFSGITGLQSSAYVTATTIPGGLVAGQTLAEAQIRYRLDAGSQNLSLVAMELRRQSGQRLQAASGEPATDGLDMGTSLEGISGALPPDAIDGLLRPPPGDLTGATQLRPFWITVRGLPGQVASGTVRLALPQLRAA
ncbi:SGNH/GDSL hydrolase family protein [Aureimonas jatrophae]|uniref:SGNH/GDSL hydrolase family protein n=1 Tax=Aureimonas jatrophae TaxID=1166073 RepID=UPI00147F1BC4|nr:SGNH/GDSL hydrolase family protein [Aureimonas jatrophae]MBB3951194.1 hypothetical protein [Aureimonas jatrophae]